MNSEEKKYNDVVGFLKRSKPAIPHQEIMKERILQRVRSGKQISSFFDTVSNYLFGWAYIGWVRNSLVTASFFILVLFVYQQSVIIKRMNSLERQIVYTNISPGYEASEKSELRGLIKKAEYAFPAAGEKLLPGQVDELIKSFNELQIKYMDVLKIIKEDPEIRKQIEKKLNQNDRKKLNL